MFLTKPVTNLMEMKYIPLLCIKGSLNLRSPIEMCVNGSPTISSSGLGPIKNKLLVILLLYKVELADYYYHSSKDLPPKMVHARPKASHR
jgi:hypothetical protein